MKTTWKQVRPYVAFIAVTLAVGGLSALLSHGGMQAFEQLKKPPLSPPAVVFPIVWTVLYILMGVGAARVYTSRSDARFDAMLAFSLQLFVNFFWTILFFALQKRLLAFFWLLLLLGLVIGMTALFYRSVRWTAFLQIPYILWLLLAAYLNMGVYLLNR